VRRVRNLTVRGSESHFHPAKCSIMFQRLFTAPPHMLPRDHCWDSNPEEQFSCRCCRAYPTSSCSTKRGSLLGAVGRLYSRGDRQLENMAFFARSIPTVVILSITSPLPPLSFQIDDNSTSILVAPFLFSCGFCDGALYHDLPRVPVRCRMGGSFLCGRQQDRKEFLSSDYRRYQLGPRRHWLYRLLGWSRHAGLCFSRDCNG